MEPVIPVGPVRSSDPEEDCPTGPEENCPALGNPVVPVYLQKSMYTNGYVTLEKKVKYPEFLSKCQNLLSMGILLTPSLEEYTTVLYVRPEIV
jgi:hypothetical protein